MSDASSANVAAHWTWRAPQRVGPAVIFDLDGVLADASHRQHFLRDGRTEWDEFFAAATHDPPLEQGVRHGAMIRDEFLIVILTARPFESLELTNEWLGVQGVRADLLILRPDGDRRPSSEFKRAEVLALRSFGIEPRLAFDDDPRIVNMYRTESVPATYVYSGYYEA